MPTKLGPTRTDSGRSRQIHHAVEYLVPRANHAFSEGFSSPALEGCWVCLRSSHLAASSGSCGQRWGAALPEARFDLYVRYTIEIDIASRSAWGRAAMLGRSCAPQLRARCRCRSARPWRVAGGPSSRQSIGAMCRPPPPPPPREGVRKAGPPSASGTVLATVGVRCGASAPALLTRRSRTSSFPGRLGRLLTAQLDSAVSENPMFIKRLRKATPPRASGPPFRPPSSSS